MRRAQPVSCTLDLFESMCRLCACHLATLLFIKGLPLPLYSLETKIANHPELFTSCSSVRETLGLFLHRHHLLDAPSTVLENDVQLVEAAFGRIKFFGGAARTVLDEPLALKATIDYFHEKDPSLVAATERAMLHSDNPSVHGSMWETSPPTSSHGHS